MTVHLKGGNGTVHAQGHSGDDRTLCGDAVEGDYDDGFAQMVETSEGIDCPACIAIIEFCQRIRAAEIKAPYQRRRA